MAKGDHIVTLDKLFSKGIVKNLWQNKTADHYADNMVNLRIKNGGITPRKWVVTIFDWEDANPIQWITANSVNETLLVVQDDFLRKINTWNDPVDDTSIWDISFSGNVRFINYGIYTIILTGAGYPRVYNNTSLAQLTSSNIAVNTNPSFWVRYAWFTVVNSNLNSNVILISRPVTLANQEYSYDWAGSWSETITFDTKVLGMTSTLNYLWIFTQDSIEYISRDNLTTTGGIASLFAIPIASGDELMNPDTVVNANEFIFYMTASRRIKTINYVQGNPVPQVAVISEEINEYLQTELNTDQSTAFATFDKQENLVKFWVRSTTSTVNDTCIIWDLNAQTRFVDKDKYYADMTELNDVYYAGSAFSYRVIQDEVGTDDDNSPVEWEFESTYMDIWNPTMRKQFRGNRLAGRINTYATIDWEFAVDGNTVMSKQIVGSTIPWNGSDLSLWIGGSEIWWEPIAWPIAESDDDLSDFERVATQGAIRATGKKCKISLSWWQLWQKLIIDYADITIRPRIRELISDKV